MVSEEDSVFKVLKDSTRQRILLMLLRHQPLMYGEMMTQSKVSNTGRFNYHLKILAVFLEKGEDGKYRLTEKGYHVAQLLANGPSWNLGRNNLVNRRNVLLIGTFGFALILLNPAILENFVGELLVVGFWPTILVALYGFLVPGAFMWFLTNNRLKNHEFQNRIKAPLFSILLLACFVITFALIYFVALLVWGVRIGFPPLQTAVTAPQTVIQKSGHQVITTTTQQMTYANLSISILPVAGIYSSVGFLVAEAIQRLREHE
jgi:hypothetical protein